MKCAFKAVIQYKSDEIDKKPQIVERFAFPEVVTFSDIFRHYLNKLTTLQINPPTAPLIKVSLKKPA